MKNFIYLLIFLVNVLTKANAQTNNTYKHGEWIQFRVHYGIINAGYATMEMEEKTINNQKLEHVIGKGWSTGMLSWVFPVEDRYESFINPKTGFPVRAIRKVKEGKHTKNVELFFEKDSVLTVDHKRNEKEKAAAKNVQDMIAAFYYLRNNVSDSLKIAESVEIDMFFDGKKFPFKLVKLGEETIKTKFGKIKCIKFRPLVQSGRVFKAKESLTLWITADKNKIPVRIQADLAVGALKADIDEYKGLSHPLNIIID
ncbi:ATP-dependent exonuclease [Wenyingzhuangia fucanilytica]|uniref:ATP-dependent exonuclease n=1 Tax=Wenyingzhuangia fucanilytica TaxID=1790137 RepID=A0A1B1Y8S5_9FLAO|nr:DUF3108 domain-containing protein [Wenyingzhuangia fucanilytica]ANW97172.1 ATP-dependent exonuclease [Wenyingzhuangia fucanilytica]